MDRVTLSIHNLTKSFAGIKALKNADLTFESGEIHALLGENGAGKSTLCKMLSGSYYPDSGTIQIGAQTFKGFTPIQAKQNGIGMIYQEFNLVPEMTVYENLFLGKEIRKGIDVDRNEMIRQSKELFKKMEVDLDPSSKISDLSVAYCQLVEIGKALLEKVRFLIMDEPTAPLTMQEVESLFHLVKELKKNGVTIIYISHRIEELLELSDCVTIMRDGEIVTTLKTKETNRPELIRLMVGHELGGEYPDKGSNIQNGKPLLKVTDLNTDKIHNVSFEVYPGEVLGLSGLVGAGRTETLRAIFGADIAKSGTIQVKDNIIHNNSPADGIKSGIAYIPEDRKRQGVLLRLSIADNISMIRIKSLSKFLTVNRKHEKALVDKYINSLSIKLSSLSAAVSSLSGGNQQKVVLSKWLSSGADIILLDEPTRGIDVGAKREIYYLIDSLKKENKAIVLVSSEMMEVIGLCTRVVVMHEGRVQGELKNNEITQENILELASGGSRMAVNGGCNE